MKAVIGYSWRILGLDVVQGISYRLVVWASTFFKGI